MAESLAVRPPGSIEAVRAVLDDLAARSPAHTGGAEASGLTALQHIAAREAEYAPMPEWVRPELAGAYAAKGVRQLYTHQAEAAETVRGGRNTVVVTPTASGKTLCYNLPILNAILEDPDTRALYLFPTKALAQDQLAELYDLAQRLESVNREYLEGGAALPASGQASGAPTNSGRREVTDGAQPFGVFTYDGDTPADARRAIRERGHIVLTNPDMLHTGILPHHTKWTRLFENLRYIVIDELHTCRGVFGSHLANVLRRLRRIARFYGSDPVFVCCSATIANPGALAEQLLEAPVAVVDRNGAPAAEKYFAFWNPPVVNRFLGIRRSYINESCRVAREFLGRGMQTIVFANSRLHTELLLTYLQNDNPPAPGQPEPVRGYRGGYLPGERREIERGLRDGAIRGVVATNALELGIDIGSLDSVVLAGYPGTIAGTWQRAGRAGRRSGTSCAVLVASSSPLDQFIVRHPEYFFASAPERAFIQPDNLEILLNHLKCAAFELPLDPEETFGAVNLPELCEHLERAGFLHRSGGAWHWTQEAYPADTVSLRSVTSDNFVIVNTAGGEDGEPEIIGEVDFSAALATVHPKAIYIHQGEQYHVDRLDFDQRKAYVRPVNADYYTDAVRYTQVRILDPAEEQRVSGPACRAHGDVLVRSQVVGFKKIKFWTNENVGAGQLELPENEMHTTSYWITLERALVESLPFSISERQNGMLGLLYGLESMAALLLMCDRRDLGTAIGERPPSPQDPAEATSPEDSRASGARDAVPLPEHAAATPTAPGGAHEFFEPNMYLYDAYPGGIGFSQPLFEMHTILLERTRELVSSCPCERGCPSCVGPAPDSGERTKQVALEILGRLCG